MRDGEFSSGEAVGRLMVVGSLVEVGTDADAFDGASSVTAVGTIDGASDGEAEGTDTSSVEIPVSVNKAEGAGAAVAVEVSALSNMTSFGFVSLSSNWTPSGVVWLSSKLTTSRAVAGSSVSPTLSTV